MKNTIIIFIFNVLSFGSFAQEYVGTWESYHTSNKDENLKNVLIVTNKYQVLTTYISDSGVFLSCSGGSWEIKDDTLIEHIEFDSKNPENVGREKIRQITINDSMFKITSDNITMKKIKAIKPGDLQGAWLMSGRTIDGETQLRNTDTPRKTMKTLSGTHFQWIAYNTDTKQFLATGGGTYTTENGIYTEKIEFFSRDNSRVGLVLKFDYSLVDGNWHHSGFSSKGDPIDEVWSKRK